MVLISPEEGQENQTIAFRFLTPDKMRLRDLINHLREWGLADHFEFS